MQNPTIFIDTNLQHCEEILYEPDCVLVQAEMVTDIDVNLPGVNFIKSHSDHSKYLPYISVCKKEFENENKEELKLFMKCPDDVIVEEVAEQEVISDSFDWFNLTSDVGNPEEIVEISVSKMSSVNSISNHYQCSFCCDHFSEKSQLLDHLFLDHSKETLYQCHKCEDIFRRKKALINHIRSHDKSLESGRKMLFETNFHSNVSDTAMKENIYKSETENSERLHSAEQKIRISKLKISNLRDCSVNDTTEMEIHRNQCTKSNFQCFHCKQIFLNNTCLMEHLCTKHSIINEGFICGYCGKRCKDFRGLQKHSTVHSNGEMLSCNTCGKQFYTRTRLKRHMLSHRNKEVVCNECGKKMVDHRALANHRSSHHVIISRNGALTARTFPCYSCNKVFGSKSSQQIHMRIHTGERPYSCRYCVKAFADGGTLRKHERIHTGEKPYVCPICRKAFNQRVVLREHIRAHHAGSNEITDKFLECEVCHEVCYSSQELCSHLVKHSDENTAKQRSPLKRPRKYKKWRTLECELKKEAFVENKRMSGGSDNLTENKVNDDKVFTTCGILTDEDDLGDNRENELVPCAMEQYDKNTVTELPGIRIYIENNDNFLSFTDDMDVQKWKLENNEINSGVNVNYHLLSPFSDKLPEECINITENCEVSNNVETCLNLISISDHKNSDNYFNANVVDCNDKRGMWFALKEKYEFAFDTDFCVYSGLGLGATVELQSEF